MIDDDVVFCRGDVGTFVGIARKAGLALAQPSHTFASYSSHALTVARPLSTARRTSFVEIGPVTFFRSDSRERLLAPEVAPAMGYGTEIRWREIAQRDGLAMGIVDAVRIRHLRRVGIGYDVRGQWARTNEMLAAAGAASWADFQQVLAVWRPWRRTAPWAEERRP